MGHREGARLLLIAWRPFCHTVSAMRSVSLVLSGCFSGLCEAFRRAIALEFRRKLGACWSCQAQGRHRAMVQAVSDLHCSTGSFALSSEAKGAVRRSLETPRHVMNQTSVMSVLLHP